MQQPDKRLLNGCYQKVSYLGAGAYGQVSLYRKVHQRKKNLFNDFFYSHSKQSESQYFALKKYLPNFINDKEGTNFSILREINLLNSITHKNIACCHEIIHKKPVKGVQNMSSHHEVYAVLDFYLELKNILSLPHIIKDEKDKKLVCYEILEGIAFLHRNYIFHRDLKPQNIFVSQSGEIKISDFGFAKQFGSPHGRYTANTCTKEYRAPQLFFKTHYYTEKSDIWSFGCLIAYIFKNQTIFLTESHTDMEVLARIFRLRGTPNQSTWPAGEKFPEFLRFQQCQPKDLRKQLQLGEDVAALIESCLQLNPVKRPSAEELLKHPFFDDRSERLFGVGQFYDEILSKITKKNLKQARKIEEEMDV